mmetsp:Transcript_66189/g.158312  ORF Transcript_66189/g.158312 Transcript_66189/m.158312 type:complete len:420 (+) Transcript_66189:88-1347(+)
MSCSRMARSCTFMVLLGSAAAGMLRSATHRSGLESYSYSDFKRDFAREAMSAEEHLHRERLFEASLAQIRQHNSQSNRLWTAGVHAFMDWTQEEKRSLNGYKPGARHERTFSGAQSEIQIGEMAFTSVSSRTNASWDSAAVRNQGSCGSCWAISAVEAAEAQLRRQGGEGAMSLLSAQALIDCVPNPQHCGGSGGCDGATGELAYSYMRDHGIPLESDMPYHARTESCSLAATSSKRVHVSGWTALPSNQAAPLIQALNEKGPIVVAVDGNDWFNYESGIFDGCSKDAILGHAVLLKGYGSQDGTNYWLIQNSWGREWGENGDIRLLRHDDEDSWCGVDDKPKEGVGCDGGPAKVTVCGSCGLLFDPIIPEGVSIQDHSTSALSTDMMVEPAAAPSLTTQVSDDSSDKSMDDMLQQLRR